MRRLILVAVNLVAAAGLLAGCAATPPRPSAQELQRQVADTERSFARTMADRDFAAFTAMLSDEAIFFSGPDPRRGKQEISNAWRRFYQQPDAPFSWEPDRVEVLDSGALALSTGPVRDRNGKLIARFTSIWRLEAPGTWRIIFDQGCELCDCARN